MTRIADGTRKGSASWSREYAIGFASCHACRSETPEPPQAVLDDLAADGSTISTVWPFEHWNVPGWINIHEHGHICDRCARAVMALLGKRRSSEAVIPSDISIIESSLAQAIQLARDGLLTAFPPTPRPYKEGNYLEGYRFQHPTKSTIWRRLEDYREGMLRERIREILDVLEGRLPGADE